MEDNQGTAVLNEHQQEENLDNVQDAIEQVMGTKVYDKFKALDEKEKKIREKEGQRLKRKNSL